MGATTTCKSAQLGEKEKGSSLSIMKRDGTADSRMECSRLLCDQPGAMMRSQPELMLTAMSGSVAMQPRGLKSLAHITSREHGASLVRATTGDHMNVLGLCRAGLAPHCLQCTRELTPHPSCSSILEGRS